MGGWKFVNPDGSDQLRKRKAEIVSYDRKVAHIPGAEFGFERRGYAGKRRSCADVPPLIRRRQSRAW